MNVFELPRTITDFETKSELDVRDVGAWRYSEHPSTEVLFMSYKRPGGDTGLWDPSQPFPQELIDRAENPDEVFEAHNAPFEMAIWLNILHKRMGIPIPKRWMDTMATCAYRAIPQGLDEVGRVLGLKVQKDKRGKYLLNQLSKPRKPLKKEKKDFEDLGIPEDKWPTLWREDDVLMQELGEYCVTDADSEDDLGDTIGDLPLPEYRVWTMDQRINYRGVRVDVEAVEAAIGIIELMSAKMERELQDITEGAVQTGSQVAKIVEWINAQGLSIDNLRAETVTNVLEDIAKRAKNPNYADYFEAFTKVKRVLEIRQTLGSSSVKKLYKFRDTVCADSRIRGLLQYHGAGTGRWAGRLVQPQNFPRGELEAYCDLLGMSPGDCMDLLIDTIKLGGQDAIDMIEDIFGNVIDALTTSLRGMFVAAPGKKYRVADFSAIEAVVTAWLAGEDWKIAAFEAIQRGEGYEGSPDMYCAAASKVFGKPITDKKKFPKERQVGKVCELAFGYQGGVGAWRNFDRSDSYSDDEVEEFKVNWRKQHPAIAGEYNTFINEKGELIEYFKGGLWQGLESAAVEALQTGKRVGYRYVAFEPVTDKAGKWLTMILPNGKRLWYYNPELAHVRTKRSGERVYQVTYEGRDNKRGGAWGRIYTYGGMLTENAVQAISRELMVEAMIRVEKAGYCMILTVHDEIVSEDDEDFGSREEFEHLMSIVPVWARGCPIAVDGWEGYRYRK